MSDQLINRVRQCPTLPSLPAVAIEVLQLAQQEHADIAEIARVISKDPALSSKILRTVNSSFYGRSQSVSTITQALVILGLQSVKTLVLGFSLVNNLARKSSKGFNHLTYWRRSIYAATAARTIAARLSVVQQEECFLVALLMDIGMLVLDQVIGEKYGEVCSGVRSHVQLSPTENQILGATHGDVAGALAEHWKLPPLLSTPIKNHDRPESVVDPALRRLSEVACLAGRCADVFVDDQPAAAIADVRQMAQRYNLGFADCDQMLAEIGDRTQEVAPLFEIKIGSGASYEAIQKKANEALVEMTLRTQQQATELQQQNQQLKTEASTDPLTGLANRRQFDRFIAEQFALAQKQNRSLALLMMDLDKFKSINDGYGHPVGDQVLRAAGKIVRGAARSQDLAARYGGEEIVLVLPGTGKSSASMIAESIRRSFAAKPIRCDRVGIPVTISIGVAAFEPGMPLKTVAHLMKAADMAVYAAKQSGRNCVRVFSLPPKGAAA